MPRIYIALATYNGEKFLSQMLNSLASQTRSADKIFVVDDASEDSTVQILESFKNKLPIQLFIQQKNGGHRSSFSKVLSLIAGEANEDDYIALADQDDEWLPDKLEILEKNIDDADLIFGDAKLIDASGKIFEESFRKRNSLISILSTKALLTGFTNVTGCLTLFKAKLLSTILPIPENAPVHDQWITFCASIKNGYKSIPDKVIKYRIHENNSIGLGENCHWSERLSINLRWIRSVIQSPIFQNLTSEEKNFALEFEKYLTLRFKRNVQIKAIPWAWKNRSALYPQCKTSKEFISRVIFAAIGVNFAKKFLGKK